MTEVPHGGAVRWQLLLARALQPGPIGCLALCAWIAAPNHPWIPTATAAMGLLAAVCYLTGAALCSPAPILILRPFAVDRAYEMLDWFVLPVLPFIAPVVTLQDQDLRVDQFRGMGLVFVLAVGAVVVSLITATMVASSFDADSAEPLGYAAAAALSLAIVWLVGLTRRIDTETDLGRVVRRLELRRYPLARIFGRRMFVLHVDAAIWQRAVSRIMRRSCLLLFVIDPWRAIHPGLRWELDEALRLRKRVLVLAVQRDEHAIAKVLAEVPRLTEPQCHVVGIPLPAHGATSISYGALDVRRGLVCRAILSALTTDRPRLAEGSDGST